MNASAEPHQAAPSHRPTNLAVIIPTFNEAGNLSDLVGRIRTALTGIAWEIVIVDDDSPDGTPGLARSLYREDPRIRCIRRIGRRGLASACIEGMLSVSTPYVAVMDADLQHDPQVLRRMFAILQAGEADVVVGSRYVQGGSVGAWNSSRVRMSRLATHLASLSMHVRLSDPMSGFFMLRREVVEECAGRLSALGFKILLDIITAVPRRTRVRELPIVFAERHAGESKISANVAWEFALLLADKLLGRHIPVRFLAFAATGTLGVLVHFAMLTILFRGLGLPFTVGQAGATVVAMVSNYSVNNVLTYAGLSLRGSAWWRGLASFMIVCGVGALGNVGVAKYLFDQRTPWTLAALAGIVVGTVWNYAVSARYTWRAT